MELLDFTVDSDEAAASPAYLAPQKGKPPRQLHFGWQEWDLIRVDIACWTHDVFLEPWSYGWAYHNCYRHLDFKRRELVDAQWDIELQLCMRRLKQLVKLLSEWNFIYYNKCDEYVNLLSEVDDLGSIMIYCVYQPEMPKGFPASVVSCYSQERLGRTLLKDPNVYQKTAFQSSCSLNQLNSIMENISLEVYRLGVFLYDPCVFPRGNILRRCDLPGQIRSLRWTLDGCYCYRMLQELLEPSYYLQESTLKAEVTHNRIEITSTLMPGLPDWVLLWLRHDEACKRAKAAKKLAK